MPSFYEKIYAYRVIEHRFLKFSEWLSCLLCWATLCSVENWDSETSGAYAGGVIIKSWCVSSIYLIATIIGCFGLCNCLGDKSSEHKLLKSLKDKINWVREGSQMKSVCSKNQYLLILTQNFLVRNCFFGVQNLDTNF